MIRMANTHATMGRRMKKWLNMRALARPAPATRTPTRPCLYRLDLFQGRLDGGARASPLEPVDDDPVRRRESLDDHAHCPVKRPGLYATDFDGVFVVHDQGIPPVLIGQKGDIGGQHGI